MTNYESQPTLRSAGVGDPMDVASPNLGLFFANDMSQSLKEMCIVLKRINSKLWKIHKILEDGETNDDNRENQ